MKRNKIPLVSFGILIINLIVFIYMETQGSTFDFVFLLEKGALSFESFFIDKNYYCIITHMFMHSGVEHFAYNMFILVVVGYYYEKEIGHVRYFITYIVSGLFAGAISLLWDAMLNDYTVSVGASGAVYGMIGVFLAGNLIDENRKVEIGPGRIVLFLVFALYCDSFREDVNYVAHIAGFICGCIMGFLFVMINKVKKKGERGN